MKIFDESGHPVERAIRESQLKADSVERGQYRHYMLKEIFEQPRAIAETLEGRFNGLKLIEETFGPGCGKRIVAVGDPRQKPEAQEITGFEG